MLTFLATLRSAGRLRGGRRPHKAARHESAQSAAQSAPSAVPASAAQRLIATLAAEGSSESGIALIEVMVSAVLAAIITVGTLTGFDGAQRATAEERARNQATLLAGQDEERLRGLGVLQLTRYSSETKPVTENGTSFEVKSSAQYISAEKEALSCETSPASADFIQTTSQVSWPALGEREPVTQSSIIAVPKARSLLVKVKNQNAEPVEGATVRVSVAKKVVAEQTTPAAGCVVFGEFTEKEVEVVGFKSGWFNEKGESPPPTKTVSLTANGTTSAEFVIAQPASIVAEFEAEGTPVSSEIPFVASQSKMTSEPVSAGTYSPTETLTGLYPFATPGSPPKPLSYTVYAGECKANNEPHEVSASLENKSVGLEGGAVAHKRVETPPINITVYEGTSETSKGALDTKAEVKLTNECSGAPVRKLTLVNGTLEHKYWPYAKTFKLCINQTIGTSKYKYLKEFSSNLKAGVNLGNVFMSATANKSTSFC
jgi:Tfp pilus assembly protein PilV